MSELLHAFFQEGFSIIKPESVLFFKESAYTLFPDFSCFPCLNLTTASSLKTIEPNSKYDIIIGDIAIQQKTEALTVNEESINVHKNWRDIYDSLHYLSEDGIGLFILGPWGFMAANGMLFEKVLNAGSFFVNAYFSLPDGVLNPITNVKPLLVTISRRRKDKLFIAEMPDADGAATAARVWFSRQSGIELPEENVTSNNIDMGIEEFKDTLLPKFASQMEALEKHDNFERFAFLETIKDVRFIQPGESVRDDGNVIYIPRYGDGEAVSRIADAVLEHDKYYQIHLKDTVFNEYLALFFQSSLGKDVLNALINVDIIASVKQKKQGAFVVALPNLTEQKMIVETKRKLDILKEAINRFDNELAINKKSAQIIVKDVDKMLAAINALSHADRIHALIREGETKTIEFKETFELHVRLYESEPKNPNIKNKAVQDESLKTIAAFLNSNGGVLLIGVKDDGSITGVEKEISLFHLNEDKFMLHFKSHVQTKIGEQFYPYIEINLVPVNMGEEQKTVLVVECKPSEMPCYLNGKDFYVRTNPATDKLEGPKILEYVMNHHFKNFHFVPEEKIRDKEA